MCVLAHLCACDHHRYGESAAALGAYRYRAVRCHEISRIRRGDIDVGCGDDVVLSDCGHDLSEAHADERRDAYSGNSADRRRRDYRDELICVGCRHIEVALGCDLYSCACGGLGVQSRHDDVDRSADACSATERCACGVARDDLLGVRLDRYLCACARRRYLCAVIDDRACIALECRHHDDSGGSCRSAESYSCSHIDECIVGISRDFHSLAGRYRSAESRPCLILVNECIDITRNAHGSGSSESDGQQDEFAYIVRCDGYFSVSCNCS